MHAAALLAVIAPLSVAAQFFTVMPPGVIDVPACETAVTKALQQVYDCGAHFNMEGEVTLVGTEAALSACACAPANATIISAPATACKNTQTAAQQLALFARFGSACAADASKAAEATSAAPRTSAAVASKSLTSAAVATAATSAPAAATSSKSSGYALAVGATVAAAAMLLL
ncbi:hypothetical protein HDU81_010583 [Chytriomyces hyalinus]|nr:hypothetical protein HDU81_010583 [Chytriomyces hyalinus]